METTDVTECINGLNEPWQREIATSLREMVFRAIPDATERLQYKKPHFLKNGHYAAVISPAKAQVTFTVFNAMDLNDANGIFEAGGPPERRSVKIKSGQVVDYVDLEALLSQAASTL